ncbi:hypothetical protein D3C79_783020 [compost metagenome]
MLDPVGLGQAYGAQGEIAFIVRIEVGTGGQCQQTGLLEQRFARQRLKFTPDLLSPLHDGHILGTLAYGKPGNARITVARAKGMRWVVAIDPHHIHARLGQLINGGGPHGTKPDDDYFAVLH